MNKPNPSNPTSEQLAALTQHIRAAADAHATWQDAERANATDAERANLITVRAEHIREVLDACKQAGFEPDASVLASVVATASSLAKAAGKGERTPYAVCTTGSFLYDCHLFHNARRFR